MNTILRYIVTIAEFVFEKYPVIAYLLIFFLLPYLIFTFLLFKQEEKNNVY